jgi:predicted component of type VI protein secretion system
MSEAKDPFLEVAAGQAIFREGDAGSEMYIIESGSVEIVRAARPNDPLATLEAGDFFGEMSILEDQPRFASAVARNNCRLLRIDRAAFGDVLAQNVEIAIRIMRKLTARLRRSDQRAQEAHAALDEFRRKLGSRAPAAEAAPAPVVQPAPRPVPPAPAPAPSPAPAPLAAPPPAAAPARVRLRHAPTGQEFSLEGKDEFLVGRPDPVTGINPEINLSPVDGVRSLSRRHAKIVFSDGQAWLREDVGTTNGTFVNGQKLKTGEPVALRAGDKIRFGSVDIDVVA